MRAVASASLASGVCRLGRCACTSSRSGVLAVASSRCRNGAGSEATNDAASGRLAARIVSFLSAAASSRSSSSCRLLSAKPSPPSPDDGAHASEIMPTISS